MGGPTASCSSSSSPRQDEATRAERVSREKGSSSSRPGAWSCVTDPTRDDGCCPCSWDCWRLGRKGREDEDRSEGEAVSEVEDTGEKVLRVVAETEDGTRDSGEGDKVLAGEEATEGGE